MKRLAWPSLLLASAIGCGQRPSQPEGIQQRVNLSSFNSCSALEQYIQDTAVRQMSLNIDASLGGGVWRFAGGGPAAAGRAGADAAAPAAFTRTNNQVAGVDEADFVKNDGTRIFALSGGRVIAAQSWPPSSLALKSALDIEGWPTQMLLDDKNRLVVLSQIQTDGSRGGGPGAFGSSLVPCPVFGSRACPGGFGITKLTVVDVANISAPRVTGEYYLPGSASAARRIGESVRVVLGDQLRWPETLKWWPEYDPAHPERLNDRDLLRAELERLKTENARIIRAHRLADWLPPGKQRLDGGGEVDLAYSCSDFYRSNAPVQLGVVTIATLDLDARSVGRTSLIGEPGEVYASKDSLYLASRHWWWWPRPGERDHTYLHKFDISRPERAAYVASGGVPGWIVDQFSMDEHRGFLRVATSVATLVDDPARPVGRTEVSSRVSVLAEAAGGLEVVGRTEDLAPGERLFSSRFVGDQAFLVTFRQIDPLFTIDLRDPSHPRKVGELKVPGYSTYLHPVDSGHLLAIGVHQPDPSSRPIDWRDTWLQISLFDVSNPADPREQAVERVGSSYGWSDATYDHKAFNFFPERKLLAIPFAEYGPHPLGESYWSGFASELRVFDIDVALGIRPRGALNMNDLFRQYGSPTWSWYYSPWVQRSIMATDGAGNDFVYALSDAGIRVANAGHLDQPLATVNYPPARP